MVQLDVGRAGVDRSSARGMRFLCANPSSERLAEWELSVKQPTQKHRRLDTSDRVSVASRDMRTLKTSEAATLLNVSPNTLRAWERRFGFPKPQRSPGRHRLYTHGEVAALRDALQEGLSISSAVSRAREGLAADTSSLLGALVSFEKDRADSAIEAALALRSVDRSVLEVLLPSLDEIA